MSRAGKEGGVRRVQARQADTMWEFRDMGSRIQCGRPVLQNGQSVGRSKKCFHTHETELAKQSIGGLGTGFLLLDDGRSTTGEE